jgi:5-methylcytosine-specific restriction endonuclease McrA
MQACPNYKNCLDKNCHKERVCLNVDYWSSYWKEKSKFPVRPETETFVDTNQIMEKIYCCYCGYQIIYKSKLTKEHLVPISLGGNSRAENIKCCCLNCNKDRANKPLWLWIYEMEQRLALINDSGNGNIFLLLNNRIKNAKLLIEYIEAAGVKLYRSAECIK